MWKVIDGVLSGGDRWRIEIGPRPGSHDSKEAISLFRVFLLFSYGFGKMSGSRRDGRGYSFEFPLEKRYVGGTRDSVVVVVFLSTEYL
jgi:hypothetical protein